MYTVVYLVLHNLFYNSNLFLYIYMFIYNCTLVSIFFILMSSLLSNLKTIYSFSNYSFDSFFLLSLSIFLFSLAGVPPFIGFFSKLFLLNILANSSFTLLYCLLFIILFLGLYFYIQNLRFLHSTNYGSLSFSYILNERKSVWIYYYILFMSITISFGFIFIDDIILFFIWLLF